ncbi:F0F1 ATP synthase subunit delta [Bacillus sp. NPDC077027]|uniref:F0F1 ATP synthase subunit delta n=1 Tax=Bacillus sp. NPDC077027 TaxID=3390548 RepID=UPI003D005B64
MSVTIVSKRYASALFDIVLASSAVDETEKELNEIKKVLKAEKELNDFLVHPKISANKKKTLIAQALQGVSTHVLHMLYLLIDRRRTNIIPEMTEEFVKLANRTRLTEDAIVYSVKPLSGPEIQSISEVFAKKAGVTSLRIENVIDKDLIGGVKIRIGNRIYDGSVSGKLSRIERQLAGENR